MRRSASLLQASLVLLAMVFGNSIASVAAAQEDHWSVTVAPYGWMMSLDGKTTVRGTTSDVDVGFDTILENLDFGAMADIRVDYDQFGAFLNVVYGKVGADAGSSIGPISIKTDLSIALTFLDFGVSYRFDPIPLGGSASGQPAPSLTIEPYVGGRYTDIDVKLKITGPMVTSRSNGDLNWVDPIIGLRTTWDLSDRVSTMVSGDIGGFGVGSDFAWNVMGVAGYRFGLFAERDATVFAGYRALGQDYSKGSGANRTSWDMIIHGPVVGMAVEF